MLDQYGQLSNLSVWVATGLSVVSKSRTRLKPSVHLGDV